MLSPFHRKSSPDDCRTASTAFPVTRLKRLILRMTHSEVFRAKMRATWSSATRLSSAVLICLDISTSSSNIVPEYRVR